MREVVIASADRDADIILAGGMENMSRSPYLLDNHRKGSRMGDHKLIDSMLRDGLTDTFGDYHMGITAENIAERWNVTREEQDEFATRSQQKAEEHKIRPMAVLRSCVSAAE